MEILGNTNNPDKEINNLFTDFPKVDFYIIKIHLLYLHQQSIHNQPLLIVFLQIKKHI
jgi:hypothetical protein